MKLVVCPVRHWILRRNAAALTVLLLLLAGCSTDRATRVSDMPDFCRGLEARGGVVISDSAGIEVITNLRPARHEHGAVDAPTFSIGVVEGNDEYEFGRLVGATRLADGRIVVADAQNAELRVFDASGQFIQRHGRKGAGPGEYRTIGGLFKTPGDTLWVTDIGNRRVTKLNPEFSVVATRQIPAVPWAATSRLNGRVTTGSSTLHVKGVLSDGSIIAANPLGTLRSEEITNVSRDSLILRRISSNFEQIDSLQLVVGIQLFEFYGTDGTVTFGEAPLGFAESLVVGADRFFYGTGERFEIEERGPDGSLLRLIRICERNDTIADHQYERVVESRLARFSPEARVYEEPALRGLPRPTMAPAYLQFQLDTSGRLWVRDFTIPGESQRWHIIDREGRWLGSTGIPGNADVLSVGAEYILARRTTELNVHVLDIHELTSPSVTDNRRGGVARAATAHNDPLNLSIGAQVAGRRSEPWCGCVARHRMLPALAPLVGSVAAARAPGG